MLERDDEDLAIEQLPAAGRADDPELAGSRALATEPAQERAAALAEPAPPAAATPARLRELRERIEQLQAQLQALPTRQLERIEDLDERALTLSSQRERARRAARGAARATTAVRTRARSPRRRARPLTQRARADDRELDAVLTQRVRLARELGDPPEMRAERDGLERAISELIQEHTEVRDELAERELHAPGAWVRDTFGERPDGPWAA